MNNVSESASQSKYDNLNTILYVYVYVCVYMSHISVALITDFFAAPAQGKPVFTWFMCQYRGC